MDKLTDGVKKLLLAGVGAVAMTAEKGSELLDDMVKKGELTVEQGKELNQELKHTVKEKMNGVKTDENGKKDFSDFVKGLSPEEAKELKEQLNKKA